MKKYNKKVNHYAFQDCPDSMIGDWSFSSPTKKDLFTSLAKNGQSNIGGRVLYQPDHNIDEYGFEEPGITHIWIGRKDKKSDYAKPIYNLDNGRKYQLQPDGYFISTKISNKQLKYYWNKEVSYMEY